MFCNYNTDYTQWDWENNWGKSTNIISDSQVTSWYNVVNAKQFICEMVVLLCMKGSYWILVVDEILGDFQILYFFPHLFFLTIRGKCILLGSRWSQKSKSMKTKTVYASSSILTANDLTCKEPPKMGFSIDFRGKMFTTYQGGSFILGPHFMDEFLFLLMNWNLSLIASQMKTN